MILSLAFGVTLLAGFAAGWWSQHRAYEADWNELGRAQGELVRLLEGDRG